MAAKHSKSWTETFGGWLPRWPGKLIKTRDQNDPEVFLKLKDVSTLSAPARLAVPCSRATRPRGIPPVTEDNSHGEYGLESSDEEICKPVRNRHSTPNNKCQTDHSYAKTGKIWQKS